MERQDAGGTTTLEHPTASDDRTGSAIKSKPGFRSRRPQRDHSDDASHERLAQTLGWFSIGLGMAELFAPRTVARIAGLPHDHRWLLGASGLREITMGLGILSERRPAGWMWSRVGGDALDLALLATALSSAQGNRKRTAAAMLAVAGIAAVDCFASRHLSRMVGWTSDDGAVLIKKTIMIDSSPEALYLFWRDFQNLSRFTEHVESVTIYDRHHSHWTVKGPAGYRVEWNAEITDDEPNRKIAWRTTSQADIHHTGSVEFTPSPGGRGTLVRVVMEYNVPAGVLGASIAKLFGSEPGQQVQSDLRRLKQIIEVGEVLRSDGSLHGKGILQQRPAQPAGSHT